jgi:hypothetical protein
LPSSLPPPPSNFSYNGNGIIMRWSLLGWEVSGLPTFCPLWTNRVFCPPTFQPIHSFFHLKSGFGALEPTDCCVKCIKVLFFGASLHYLYGPCRSSGSLLRSPRPPTSAGDRSIPLDAFGVSHRAPRHLILPPNFQLLPPPRM